MYFSGEEFDTFYGPWTPAKVALIRKFFDEPRDCWTKNEMLAIAFLRSAMELLPLNGEPCGVGPQNYN